MPVIRTVITSTATFTRCGASTRVTCVLGLFHMKSIPKSVLKFMFGEFSAVPEIVISNFRIMSLG